MRETILGSKMLCTMYLILLHILESILHTCLLYYIRVYINIFISRYEWVPPAAQRMLCICSWDGRKTHL